ncbi:MAG: hypothetical protein M1812_001051 [Candelaria pacifica]|nr:MAG: hypothetical protein M1812_001051 [Candelaria pacifica]
MSQEELEYQVEQLVGYGAVSVLRLALERCRDGRYRMRDRREQLLGDFVSTWQDLQNTIQRANVAVTQLRYRSTKDRAYSVIHEATTMSRRAVSSLATCLPISTIARTREEEEKFLFNLARDYDIATLATSIPTLIQRVKQVVQSSIREEEDIVIASKPHGGRGDVYLDDGYASYTSSRNFSTRALPSVYGNSYSTPRISYTAPLGDYDMPRNEWDYADVYREPQRMRGYSTPAPRSIVYENH